MYEQRCFHDCDLGYLNTRVGTELKVVVIRMSVVNGNSCPFEGGGESFLRRNQATVLRDGSSAR